MSDYPMLISNKLHSFRNFPIANIRNLNPQPRKKTGKILVVTSQAYENICQNTHPLHTGSPADKTGNEYLPGGTRHGPAYIRCPSPAPPQIPGIFVRLRPPLLMNPDFYP